MCKHHELFTRKAIFEAEGLVYDYEPIRQKHDEYCSPQTEFFVKLHENRHKIIDQLADVRAQNRRPEDTWDKSVFEDLQKKVKDTCKGVVEHVNKFIAHAATPESRAAVEADEARLTLDDLWKAHQHLYKVAKFLAINVLGDSFPPPLPIPQYNQFEYIERPLITAPEAEDLWQKIENETRGW